MKIKKKISFGVETVWSEGKHVCVWLIVQFFEVCTHIQLGVFFFSLHSSFVIYKCHCAPLYYSTTHRVYIMIWYLFIYQAHCMCKSVCVCVRARNNQWMGMRICIYVYTCVNNRYRSHAQYSYMNSTNENRRGCWIINVYTITHKFPYIIIIK